MICGSGGSKSRLAKAAGAEPAGQMRDEKLHAVVARSTFRSQNVQNTPASDHFRQLRCRKSARRSGAKHIFKSKCTKHTTFGPLLEVEMSKKCTPLWREAHFEVKMFKTLGVRTTFGGSDVASLHYTTLHYTPLHYTPVHYITLHYALAPWRPLGPASLYANPPTVYANRPGVYANPHPERAANLPGAHANRFNTS